MLVDDSGPREVAEGDVGLQLPARYGLKGIYI